MGDTANKMRALTNHVMYFTGYTLFTKCLNLLQDSLCCHPSASQRTNPCTAGLAGSVQEGEHLLQDLLFPHCQLALLSRPLGGTATLVHGTGLFLG